ncbi:mechanosensitive ion channel family protein [Halorientalis brevis]|uniref:Mechanosensitive ion channel family protein n=1 Tax=Halorientalis brevis TaxID=1126241 RepID=A0ABD6CGJ9_9EURY|nr:mechanosensitive ion channel family protein [Halorientalis brevis]
MTLLRSVAAPLLQAGWVQSLASTGDEQLLASLVVVAGFVLVLFLIRALGPRLKERYPADDVEAVQAVLVTLAAAATSWFLVVVWRIVDEVFASLAVIRVGPRQGALALVGVLTLIIAYTLTRVTRGVLEDRGGDVITAHRREVIHHFLQLAIYIVASTFVLSLAGVNPANLLVGAGAIGLVVGLAARQTLGAILAGIVLLFARPLEVGDWVVVDDNEGIVVDVTLFNTELRTWDDEHVMIPNDEVASSSIVNRSRSGRLRVSFKIGVDYEADVTRAAAVAEGAMNECDVSPLLSKPSPSVVGRGFGDSAVLLECRFWISDPSARRKWRTQTAVIRAVKEAFDEEGIKIPYPQRELTARDEGDGFRLAGDRQPTAPAANTDGDQQ